jgi:hypothetical protein
MQLLTSLLLLGGGPLLAVYGHQLMEAMAGYVGEVVERGLLLLLPPLDLLLVAAPDQAAPLVVPVLQVGWTGRLLMLLCPGVQWDMPVCLPPYGYLRSSMDVMT